MTDAINRDPVAKQHLSKLRDQLDVIHYILQPLKFELDYLDSLNNRKKLKLDNS